MKVIPTWSLGVATAASLLFMPVTVAAQQTSSSKVPTCMARASNSPDGRKIVLPVLSGRKAEMAAKGFAEHPCSSNHKDEATNFRAKMCEFAAKAPVGAQEQFAQMHNVTPQELCEGVDDD